MGQRTVLYDRHLKAGARMVDFAGWDMPLHYGSQLDEHNQVRKNAGVFDVSHMTVVDIDGEEASDFLRILLANDVAKLDEPGKALYSAMLNEDGGVVDDLIVYRLQDHYRLVVNCATRAKDLEWMDKQSGGFRVNLQERSDLAMLAVHGPQSIDKVCKIFRSDKADLVRELGNFRAREMGQWLVARTGYTGEKGLEVILPEGQAGSLWDRLLADGVQPVGLGARDTLRLEAGMNLYGQDMDETTSPLVAGMGRTICWDDPERDFIGRKALVSHRDQQESGALPVFKGLLLEGPGILRKGQRVTSDAGEGVITSGGYSPILQRSIALARLPADADRVSVELRGKKLSARIVKPSFVRMGRSLVDLAPTS